MRLASLFSGGKDSAYAAYVAQRQGHSIECLVSVCGRSEESMLLHNPNIRWVSLQAEAMHGTPLVSGTLDSDDTEDELAVLESLLCEAVRKHGIQGITHGGIRSRFQKERFESVCKRLGLCSVAPLWGMRESPMSYMSQLVGRHGFEFVISAVSAGGLDDRWLGRRITLDALGRMHDLSRRHGFALDFEGGEAETFVTNCPLFESPIIIRDWRVAWDGYRGRFEILDASIDCNA